jgi:hypothetical protein
MRSADDVRTLPSGRFGLTDQTDGEREDGDAGEQPELPQPAEDRFEAHGR